MATGAGLRPSAKVLDLPPDPNVHAPQIYPDCIFFPPFSGLLVQQTLGAGRKKDALLAGNRGGDAASSHTLLRR